MAKLNDYTHFDGRHYVTGFLTNALAAQGIQAPHTGKPYTEALLMGVNGGISAGYFTFHYEGHDPQVELLTYYPFNDDLVAVYDRLAIPTDVRQTANVTKATANIVSALVRGVPAIVWADIYSLGHMDEMPYGDFHMATPILVFEHDNGQVAIADRSRVPLRISASTLEAAQSVIKKFKHRVMTVGAPDADRLPLAVREGIQATIDIFTKPPHFAPQAAGNFGFAGMQRWAAELGDERTKTGWAKRSPTGSAFYNVLKTSYRSLELSLTGGGGARGVFADFLDEAAVVLNKPALREVGAAYRTNAALWRGLAEAHLPAGVDLFAETRRLMEDSYALFIDQGLASLEARKGMNERLKVLHIASMSEFPLDEAGARALRHELQARVLALHDAELIALNGLEEAMRAS